MLGQLLSLQQANKTVVEYEVEFNWLVKFSPKGIWDSERTKLQKFKDGSILELQLDIHGYEVITLGALLNKAKSMEEVWNKMKA